MSPTDGTPLLSRVRTALSAVLAFLLKCLALATSALAWLLSRIFGRFDWQAPAWIAWLRSQSAKVTAWSAAKPKHASLVLAGLLCVFTGLVWYAHRPKPHYVGYTVEAPAVTEYDDKGVPQIHPLIINFDEAAAPLQMIDKRFTRGIDLSPNVPGIWAWASDTSLRFTPKNDWPVDGAFTLRFAKKGLFATGVEVEDYRPKFRSAPFAAKWLSTCFTPGISSRSISLRCSATTSRMASRIASVCCCIISAGICAWRHASARIAVSVLPCTGTPARLTSNPVTRWTLVAKELKWMRSRLRSSVPSMSNR